MFLVVISVFYFCYLLNIVFFVVKVFDKEVFYVVIVKFGVFVYIFFCLYFISNVINLIVYGFMDERFWEECWMYYR